MKRLQNMSDLPTDFLQTILFEPGDPFNMFLTRCKDHNLFFSVEVPGDNDETDNNAMLDAINEQVRHIVSIGGPELPKPENDVGQYGGRHWEFLSCKIYKLNPKILRGQEEQEHAGTQKMNFIKIELPSTQLAPVDFNVNMATRTFGFKNPIRTDRGEPDKFVVIGM
jgi:hypothetical protein